MKFDNLEQWLEYLQAIHPKEIELGLARIQQVAERIGLYPFAHQAIAWQVATKLVVVSGTNGKGSTCAFMESVLMAAGYQVAVYSSPHFIKFNERIRIQGRDIADEVFIAALSVVEQARADVSLTFFEFTTLAALWCFRQVYLDVLILEVGLGGRQDAVNLVDADVAVVTSIGLDHADFLGTELNKIAYEKAGIARRAKPLIIGESVVYPAFSEVAHHAGAVLFRKEIDFGLEKSGRKTFRWWGLSAGDRFEMVLNDISVQLPWVNLATAIQALHCLNLAIPFDAWRSLDRAQLPGRMEPLDSLRQWRVDVTHNPQAAEFMADCLKTQESNIRKVAVIGMLADKDALAIVQPLSNVFTDWLLVTLDGRRGRSAEALAATLGPWFDQQGLSYSCWPSVADALNAVVKRFYEAPVLIFGSFVTVAAAKQWWQERHCGTAR